MRIWFNRGFSLPAIADTVIPQLQGTGIEIFIGQPAGQPHKDTLATIIDEPDLPRTEYAAWAAETVRANGIDLLVASTRRHALASAQRELPCSLVLSANTPVTDLLDDKFAFAQAIENTPWHISTRTFKSASEFQWAHYFFRKENPNTSACIKPRRGVNGHGFWHLDPNASDAAHLIDPGRRIIAPHLYTANLKASLRAIGEQVLMPFLPGPECSVDILAWEGRGLRAIVRTKLGRGHQRIESEHPLVRVALELADRFHLHGVVNAQFRADADGNWKLLEINTRPAGGSVISEYAGSHILIDWILLLAGRQTPKKVELKQIEIAHDLISAPLFEKRPISAVH